METKHWKQIADTLKDLKKLKNLAFYTPQFKINDNEFQIICQAISSLKSLKKLELTLQRDINTEIQNFEPLQQAILSLKQLQSLNLVINMNFPQEKVQALQIILDPLTELPQLTKLELTIGQYQMGSEGGIVIGKTLEKCQNLRILTLCVEQNLFKNEAWIAIAEGISNLKSLQKFKFLMPQVQDILEVEAWQSMGKCLSNLKQLKRLVISRAVEIQQQKIISFFSEISELEFLQNFQFSAYCNEKIGIQGTKSIVSSLKQFQKLEKFVLELQGQSDFQNEELSLLCEGIKNLVNLKEIRVQIQQNQDKKNNKDEQQLDFQNIIQNLNLEERNIQILIN